MRKFCPLLFLCSLLFAGCDGLPLANMDAANNDCQGAPCCWNKQLIKEKANKTPLMGIKPDQTYQGKVVLWDPTNWATSVRVTDETCSVSITLKNSQYIVASSIFPHPVPLSIQMHPQSEFYIGTHGEKDVFVFQQQRGRGVSFAHTTYDKNGELEYSDCGSKKGFFIKDCLAGL